MHRYQQTRHALGSDAYLTLVVRDEVDPNPTFDSLWHRIEAFEDRFSRFREHSELSDFNMHAGDIVAVSPDFYEILSLTKTMTDQTKGLYNPLILPALQRAGYKGSWPEVSSTPASLNYENRTVPDTNVIELTGGNARIPRDTALDLGGIGKGYLLDLLGRELRDRDISNYWLSLGGDILCSGTDDTGESWQIAIQNAHDTDNSITATSNEGGQLAIATSGTIKRRGEGWHHIIDPRTHKPAATDVLTATVCTQSAAEADVFAKCLVITGSKNALASIRKWRITDAFIQTDGTYEKATLKVGNAWLS